MEQDVIAQMQKTKKSRTRLWVVLGAAAGLIAGIVIQELRFAGGLSIAQAESLREVISIVKDVSIEEYTQDEIVDMMLSGVAQGLKDDYSFYFNAEALNGYQDDKQGIIRGGIGVSVVKDGAEPVKIVEVYENSPAQAAGLKAGDVFVKIENTDVRELSLDKVSELIAGQVDTVVRVTVQRDGEKELAFDVKRAVVQTPMVKYRHIDDLTYIQLKSFNGNAVSLFKEAVSAAEKAGSKGIILDLRDNYGGDLSILTEIADTLLPEGEIIYAMDRRGNKILSKKSSAPCTKLPLAVLTNCNTASASEALAGAIRDFGKGVLIGTKTYGKGIMQTTYPLANAGAFKLTTAKYYLPGGECIHGTGITPQYVISLPDGAESRPYSMTDQEDTQLQKAIELLHS